MNIDELQAGYELDRLIAEKVMGYNVFRWGDPDSLFVASSREAFDYACSGDTLTCYADSKRGFCFSMPNYSTDITAAWSVFKKMGCAFCIVSGGTDYSAGRVSTSHSFILNAKARADTAPLAICWAALKAHRDANVAGVEETGDDG